VGLGAAGAEGTPAGTGGDLVAGAVAATGAAALVLGSSLLICNIFIWPALIYTSVHIIHTYHSHNLYPLLTIIINYIRGSDPFMHLYIL
jgi:hypothetical protein